MIKLQNCSICMFVSFLALLMEYVNTCMIIFCAIKFISLLLDRFSWFPVTRDQLTMLMEGNVVKEQFFDDFEIIPKKFDLNNLDYLSSNDK